MEELTDYLQTRRYTQKTIKEIVRNVNAFLNWLSIHNIKLIDIQHKDFLNYVGHLQKQNFKKISINIVLKHLEHYFKFKDLDNPALGLRLIGVTDEKPILFSSDELDKIYNTYQSNEFGPYKETDKIILGLIIYQALDNQSILNLAKTNINLQKGEIFATPKTIKRESRIIKLEPHQILPLNHYIQNIYNKHNSNLFAEKLNTLINQLQFLTKELKIQLKEQNINLKSLNQLRQSRYAIWYKQYGIRKAQYLGGFKSPYTIQKYANLDIEDLKSAIEKFHPLG